MRQQTELSSEFEECYITLSAPFVDMEEKLNSCKLSDGEALLTSVTMQMQCKPGDEATSD